MEYVECVSKSFNNSTVGLGLGFEQHGGENKPTRATNGPPPPPTPLNQLIWNHRKSCRWHTHMGEGFRSASEANILQARWTRSLL